jgi:hypothetical protein
MLIRFLFCCSNLYTSLCVRLNAVIVEILKCRWVGEGLELLGVMDFCWHLKDFQKSGKNLIKLGKNLINLRNSVKFWSSNWNFIRIFYSKPKCIPSTNPTTPNPTPNSFPVTKISNIKMKNYLCTIFKYVSL